MPGVKIEWAVSKAGVWTFSVLDAYPGDSYVDLIGAHYYDVGSQFAKQRAFDNFLNSTRYGGPQGLSGRGLGQPLLHPGHVPVLQGERGQDRVRELLQLRRRPSARHDDPVPERERH